MKAFKLENEPKIESGFKTPEGYFDTLSATISERLNNEKQTKVIPIYKRKKVISSLVAAILVIALMIPVVNNYKTSKELDQETLETYLSYQSNLNQYDIIKELDNTDIQKLGKNIVLEDETMEDVLSSNPNIENLILE